MASLSRKRTGSGGSRPGKRDKPQGEPARSWLWVSLPCTAKLASRPQAVRRRAHILCMELTKREHLETSIAVNAFTHPQNILNTYRKGPTSTQPNCLNAAVPTPQHVGVQQAGGAMGGLCGRYYVCPRLNAEGTSDPTVTLQSFITQKVRCLEEKEKQGFSHPRHQMGMPSQGPADKPEGRGPEACIP